MAAIIPHQASKKFLVSAEDPHNYLFHCPGCDMLHEIWDKQAKRGGGWEFNGDFEKPTFSPSYLTRAPNFINCHSFIRDGMIQFLDDCHHALKGQTVPLPDVPE